MDCPIGERLGAGQLRAQLVEQLDPEHLERLGKAGQVGEEAVGVFGGLES